MNTNPDAIKVLCYGDSNTYGQRSEEIDKGRWPADIRWTGQLQKQLGDNYYIIEEGLGSRTTDLEYSQKPGRNGRTYLTPCLHSHNPIDVCVLMLGTNDLKIVFDRKPEEVAAAIADLVNDIKQNSCDKQEHKPRILVVSPIYIDDTAAGFAERYTGYYDFESADKSHKLAACLQESIAGQGCEFLDASTVAQPGNDGIHFSKDSHGNFAQALSTLIKN